MDSVLAHAGGARRARRWPGARSVLAGALGSYPSGKRLTKCLAAGARLALAAGSRSSRARRYPRLHESAAGARVAGALRARPLARRGELRVGLRDPPRAEGTPESA